MEIDLEPVEFRWHDDYMALASTVVGRILVGDKGYFPGRLGGGPTGQGGERPAAISVRIGTDAIQVANVVRAAKIVAAQVAADAEAVWVIVCEDVDLKGQRRLSPNGWIKVGIKNARRGVLPRRTTLDVQVCGARCRQREMGDDEYVAVVQWRDTDGMDAPSQDVVRGGDACCGCAQIWTGTKAHGKMVNIQRVLTRHEVDPLRRGPARMDLRPEGDWKVCYCLDCGYYDLDAEVPVDTLTYGHAVDAETGQLCWKAAKIQMEVRAGEEAWGEEWKAGWRKAGSAAVYAYRAHYDTITHTGRVNLDGQSAARCAQIRAEERRAADAEAAGAAAARRAQLQTTL